MQGHYIKVTDMTEMLGVTVSSLHPQIWTLPLHAGNKYCAIRISSWYNRWSILKKKKITGRRMIAFYRTEKSFQGKKNRNNTHAHYAAKCQVCRIFAHAQQAASRNTRYNSCYTLRVAYFWKKTRSQGLLKARFLCSNIFKNVVFNICYAVYGSATLSSCLYSEIMWKNRISVPRIAGGFDDCWN